MPKGKGQGKAKDAPILGASAKSTAKGGPVNQTKTECGLWKFDVVVKSTIPTSWPAQAVTVIVKITSGNASFTRSSRENVKFNKQLSTKAPYTGRHAGSVSISCVPATGELECWEPVGTATHTVQGHYRLDTPIELTIKPKVNVFLKLKWLDPEALPRLFPKDFPVTVVYDDASTEAVTVAADGFLSFAANPSRTWFTLRFGEGVVNYIASLPGAPGPATETLRDEAAAKIVQAVGYRFFALPANWNLRRSVWAVPTGGANFYDTTERRYNLAPCRKIGTVAAPVEMTLDPHWQYNRFEFFDRWFGPMDSPGGHGKVRISIPTLPIEGYTVVADIPATPATKSNWMYKPLVAAEACHALPWIIRRTEALVEEEKPDLLTVLRIATEAGTCIESTSVTERKALKITDAERLSKPSNVRLKLYDLPEEWRSTGYYTRLATATDNALYQDLTQDKHTASRTPATRFTFCLDDIVVCKDDLHPAGLLAADRVAVFQNGFGKQGGSATDLWTAVGLYKPDSANNQPFYSYVANKPGGDHITDYPDWTRLLVYKGNLYDAFDQRTSLANGHTVVGARAAVGWFDAVTGNGVGLEISPRAAINTSKPFIALQPCYEQRYSAYMKKHTGPGTPTWGIGRFDQALLRCCGHDGDLEIIINIQYFRLKYDTGEVPVISNVTGEVTDTVATIRWDTDIDAWKGSANGDTDNLEAGSPAMRKSHTMTQEGIAPTTAVTFDVHAEDYCGNRQTGQYTLTTLAAPVVPPPYVGPPPIPPVPPIVPIPITAQAPTGPVGGAATQTPMRSTPATLNTWAASACTKIMARFNGNDTALSNDKRAEFVTALSPGLPIKGQVIYLIEPAADEARAHFKVSIGSADQGRCFMAGTKGTGTYKHSSDNPENEYCPESYTAAHELGHGGSLPDEYNERWSNCSASELSFGGRLPGDPFEPDGRRNPGAAGGTVDAATTAMMNGALQMRNRYYWHAAEFARFVTGVQFKVVLGAFNEYRVPPHPNYPESNYSYWPIEELMDTQNGSSMSGKYIFRTKYAELTITAAPASSEVKAKSATIKWTTSHEANAIVEFGIVAGTYDLSKRVVESAKEHTVKLDGLSPATPYFFRAKSFDNDGNQVVSNEATFTTIAVPALTFSVAASAVGPTDTQATIKWTTDRAADTTLEYGTETGVYPNKATGESGAATHSVHLAGLTAATEYFYIVKSTDSEGAVATSAELKFTTAAAAVLTFTTAPASSALTENGATLTCKTSAAATTEVEYGLDASYGSTQAMSAAVTDHTVTLVGLTEGKIYHYRIKATPAAGTPILSGDATFETTLPKLEIVGGKISVTDISANGATVSWTTNRESNTETEHGLDVNGYPVAVIDATLTKEHRVYLTGLEVNRLFKVRATSRKDTYVTDQVEEKFYTGVASGPPLDNIEAVPTKNSATITWNTKEGANSQIEYGLTGAYGTKTAIFDPSQVTDHSVILTGLTSGKLYHYRVHSVDLAKKVSISEDKTFTTPAAVPLEMTDVKATGITTTAANITWTTSAKASSKLEYAIGTGPKTLIEVKTFLLTAHKAVLTGLTPGTVYTYSIRCVSEDGVGAEEPGFTFTTVAAPIAITAVAAGPVEDTKATIKWSTTAIDSDSKVEYGPTADYGTVVTDPKLTKDHTIELTGLTLGKQYHFRVTSAAGTPSGLSDDGVFTTTTKAAGPVITTVASTDLAEETAKITWVTNLDADNKVEYGETTDYGKVTPVGVPTKAHSVSLANLTPGKEYHYRVHSAGAGKLTISADATFKTLVRKPVIEKVAWEQLSSTQIRITWESDIEGNSQVKWGAAAPAPDYTTSSPAIAGPLKKHSVTLTVPVGAATFHFGCFTQEPSTSNKVGNSPDDTFQVAITGDPIISDVRSDNVTTDAADILWNTNVGADTEIEWGTSPAYGTSTPVNESVTAHTSSLTGLKPGTTYYARVKSKINPPKPATYDLLLYASGRERFTDGILTGGPYQGLLQIVSRIKMDFPDKNGDAYSGNYLIRFRAAILDAFNGPSAGVTGYRTKGKIREGTPQEWDMEKVFIRFVPEFLITNENTASAVAAIEKEFGTHANIVVQYKDNGAAGTITKAAETQFTLPSNHGLETGDVIEFSAFAAGSWAALNGNQYAIIRISDTEFSINVDSTGFGARQSYTFITRRRHTLLDLADMMEPWHLARVTVNKHGLKKGSQVYLATNTLGGAWTALGGYRYFAIEDENTLLFNFDCSAAGAYVGGARVQNGYNFLTVDSITAANPAVVTIRRHHLSTGDSLNISGGTGGWAAINGSHSVTLLTEDTVSIAIDSTGFGGGGAFSGISFKKDLQVTGFVDVPSTLIYQKGHGVQNGDKASLNAISPGGNWGAVAGNDLSCLYQNDDWYAVPADCTAAAAVGTYTGGNHAVVRPGTDITIDFTHADPDTNFDEQAQDIYAKLLGLPGRADRRKENYTPLVKRVLPQGGVVEDR